MMVQSLAPDRRARAGFTLIEMIVVISIIVVLAVLVAAVLSGPILIQDRARRGGDELQIWLRTAKSRAMGDQAPRGLRLLQGADGYIRELQYIEQPNDFIVMLPGSPGVSPQARGIQVVPTSQIGTINPTISLPIPAPPSTATGNVTVTCPGVAVLNGQTPPGQYDFTGGLYSGANINDSNWPVHGDQYGIVNGNPVMSQPGDYLEVQGGGALYRIVAVVVDPTANSQYPCYLLLDRAPTIPMTAPTLQYRIIRQPRPLAGETPLLLPQDVAIDPNFCLPPPTPAGSPDLLFAPSGRLLGPLGAQTQVVLWVADVTKDRDPVSGAFTGNSPVLVNIHARTGFISVQPVNLNDPTNPLKSNPAYIDSYWSFTRDGRLSGM
jgi:prepilin-type N-terminal cleavage/methylation domain-containing protein